MFFAPTLYQDDSSRVGFMIVVNASSGNIAGGGAVALNISGISEYNGILTVPDSSGNNNIGILIGTCITGSDSQGSYVYLNGGYIRIANYNVTTSFTVRILMAIDRSQTYRATLWGNESYGAAEGYYAYLGSATALSVGSVTEPVHYTIGGTTLLAQWDFVVTNSSIAVYKNGSSIGAAQSFTNKSKGDATNDLYIGSRHTNSGTGSTDTCKMKVYAVNIFTSALSGYTISSDYISNQSKFDIF
jgi:hypothetical protein